MTRECPLDGKPCASRDCSAGYCFTNSPDRVPAALTKAAPPVEAADEQDQRETVPDLVARLSDMLGDGTDFDNYSFSIKRGNLRRLLKALQQSQSTPGAVTIEPGSDQERQWAIDILAASNAMFCVEPPMRATIDKGLNAALSWAYSLQKGTTPVPVDAGGALERLGEALFALSVQLLASRFLDRDDHHAAYERVVAAFQTLERAALHAAPAPGGALASLWRKLKQTRAVGDPHGWDHYAAQMDAALHAASTPGGEGMEHG